MLYDYIITQFYPMIPIFFCISLMIITIISAIFYSNIPYDEIDKREYFRKWTSHVVIIVVIQTLWLTFLMLIPDVNYMKHYYGDVRTLTPEQRIVINKQISDKYIQSEKLFLECLDKGQKQPNKTVFNDTNEVVKTCYSVAKFKF